MAGPDARGVHNLRQDIRLITQRSQVQILPPLQTQNRRSQALFVKNTKGASAVFGSLCQELVNGAVKACDLWVVAREVRIRLCRFLVGVLLCSDGMRGWPAMARGHAQHEGPVNALDR